MDEEAEFEREAWKNSNDTKSLIKTQETRIRARHAALLGACTVSTDPKVQRAYGALEEAESLYKSLTGKVLVIG